MKNYILLLKVKSSFRGESFLECYVFRKLFKYIYIIQHTSRIFQTFTMCSKVELPPLLSSISALRMFRKPFRYICILLHTSSTFQTFTMCSKIEFLYLLNSMECFYAYLRCLLGTNVLSRIYLVHISHILHTFLTCLAHSKLVNPEENIITSEL